MAQPTSEQQSSISLHIDGQWDQPRPLMDLDSLLLTHIIDLQTPARWGERPAQPLLNLPELAEHSRQYKEAYEKERQRRGAWRMGPAYIYMNGSRIGPLRWERLEALASEHGLQPAHPVYNPAEPGPLPLELARELVTQDFPPLPGEAALPKARPARLHAANPALHFLLAVLSAGMWIPGWVLWQRRGINKISPVDQLGKISNLFCLGAMIFGLIIALVLAGKGPASPWDPPDQIPRNFSNLRILYFFTLMFAFSQVFRIRSILVEHLGRPVSTFSCFFLHLGSLQSAINQAVARPEPAPSQPSSRRPGAPSSSGPPVGDRLVSIPIPLLILLDMITLLLFQMAWLFLQRAGLEALRGRDRLSPPFIWLAGLCVLGNAASAFFYVPLFTDVPEMMLAHRPLSPADLVGAGLGLLALFMLWVQPYCFAFKIRGILTRHLGRPLTPYLTFLFGRWYLQMEINRLVGFEQSLPLAEYGPPAPSRPAPEPGPVKPPPPLPERGPGQPV